MIDQLPQTIRSGAKRVAKLSPFFEQLLENHSESALEALMSASKTLDRHQLRHRYDEFVGDASGEALSLKLRLLRSREMVRIIYRDLQRVADLFETTAELSHLADYCVSRALDDCYAIAIKKYGQPLRSDGNPEKMIVLAMGKLGAFELNLSSDIDLIFFYEQQGQFENPAGKIVTHQEFFLRLARQLINCLDDAGAIDNVFRVDMRLRPYGDSGPLVLHRDAMEKYYVEQGRNWERYAFIKARVIAGDIDAGQDFLGWMKPFVYRRHLDFGAIQSLREMKGLIARQVELKSMNDDLKLGPGGIREIEFIVQAHQLIWGGRYPDLQTPALRTVMVRLQELEFVPQADTESLMDAYCFLRNSEHAIQAEHDKQTHTLPADDISQSRLAASMGEPDYATYIESLEHHRSEVQRCFASLITASAGNETPAVESIWLARWQNPDTQPLVQFRAEVQKLELADEVLSSLDQLMPRVLSLIEITSEADLQASELALSRLLPVISAVLRRSTYLVFMLENLDALRRAVELVTISAWIAEQLAAYPILLYELTDRAVKEVAVSKIALEGELREVMRAVDPGDLEAQMDTLRQFKLAAMLKIAAMELLDEVSIMQASDGLTALAEVLLETSLDLAWRYLSGRHGLPCDKDGQPLPESMAIIAYGKAGGFELAYGSDLDLVFLCPNEISGSTDGRSSINNNKFFVRLGQRVVHILTSFTRFGILYSVDLRLRPQGNKGPLVATIGAFRRYQANDAWTWEHQALVRARFVAGDAALGQAFAETRQEVLESPREPQLLLEEVLNMRERMREHLASPTQKMVEEGSDILGRFDLKHDAGAIVDIEFMVQYAVLASAAKHRVLSRWTDMMRLLDELGTSGLMAETEAESLQRAYLTFRAAVHHGWLGLETDFERLQSYREEVHQIWQKRMLAETGQSS